MKITLNGLELARHAEAGQTIGHVLNEIREEIHGAGKAITQVTIDDRPLPEGWQRRQCLAAQVSGAQCLALTIEESRDLRNRTLRDAAVLTEKLVEQTRPLGRMFRLGDEVSANTDLSNFLDDLKLIVAGLDHSTRPGGKQDPESPLRGRVIQSANQLLPTLDRLYKAQAGGDYIAVADELEYDLRDQLCVWKDLLSEARALVDKLPQAQ
jgi:hypothetical protein